MYKIIVFRNYSKLLNIKRNVKVKYTYLVKLILLHQRETLKI